MLKVYTIPESLYSAKLRILLRFKGLVWEEMLPPGGYGSDEFKQYVPSGNLPSLQIGEFQLADSEAIAEYLNEAYPIPAALPEDMQLRAKLRELSRFHDTRLEPALRAMFKFLHQPEIDRLELGEMEVVLQARLDQLAKMLPASPVLQMRGFALCDCGYPITFLWIELLAKEFGFAICWPVAVSEYRHDLQNIVAVEEELKRYRPILESFLLADNVA